MKIRDTTHEETYETKENKAEMLTIFNVFFAASMIINKETEFFVPFDRHQLSHFVKLDEEDDTQGLQISYTGYSDRNLELNRFDPFERGISEVVQSSRKITIVSINQILVKMQKIMQEDYLIVLSDLIVKSYTHKLYKEEIQSFLISWMVIEEILSQKYNNYFKEKEIDDDLLTDFDRDHLVKKIKTLKKINIINGDTFNMVNNLRVKRNNMIHKLEIIDNEAMEECFSLAFKLLSEEVV